MKKGNTIDEKSADMLNELIEITRDGERFYLDAARKVRSQELRGIFRQMAQVRQDLIDDLGDHVLARGEVPSDERTLAGTARKLYADMLATIRADEETAYVAELEEAEDRLLDRYSEALDEAPTAPVREILERHLPTVRAAHSRMRRLKDMYKESHRAGR
jgi:uncharacterized protein (TIGR02284 family)